MDISQIGNQNHNINMRSPASNASLLQGSLEGMSVQVNDDPNSALADSAEELTFAKDNSRQTKLSDRKQKAHKMDLEAKIQKLLKTVQAASNNDNNAQNKVYNKWKNETKNVKDLLQSLKALGGHAASIYAFLLQKEREENDSEYKALLKEAAEAVFLSEKSAITASLNALEVSDPPSFSTAFDLSQTYSEIATTSKEPLDILDFLKDRYGQDNIKAGIDYLFKALAADLMSSQRSQEEQILNDIAGKLAQTKTLNASMQHCQNFTRRADRFLGIEHKLEPSTMLWRLTDLSKARFVTPLQIEKIYGKEMPVKDPEQAVLLGQEFFKMLRELPLELFANLEDRNKLVDATQKLVDQLIEKEDEWLEAN